MKNFDIHNYTVSIIYLSMHEIRTEKCSDICQTLVDTCTVILHYSSDQAEDTTKSAWKM